MKKLLTLFAAISMLFVAGCGGDDYDDTAIRNEITDLANRVAKLEQLCQQMNTNISSLQTIVNALQKNDYITAVTPITQNGKVVGYTIAFAKSGAITIYHGQDGKDGANGKDGYTPQIGVKKDTDGYYYWTLDGKWLTDESGNKIKAVGTNGKDGEDGQDGKPGSDGEDGQDGQDGITPQLKIEEGYWYVSYDNGSSWIQLGKATGEDGADGSDGIDGSDGKDGVDGEDGDSIFSGVSQDDEFVYFHLSDGTMITLPKHDKENIQFEDLNVKAICCKNWDTNNDGELSYTEAAAVTDLGDKFTGDTNIIAFSELKHFTGLTEISSKAFYECTNLWKVNIPGNVKIINEKAFYNCAGLTVVYIQNGVAFIGEYAFSGCLGLSSIHIPDSVNTIENYAFRYTGLKEVTIGSGIIEWGSFIFPEVGEELICYSNIRDLDTSSVGSGVFATSCFKRATISGNAVKIGSYAFCHEGQTSSSSKLETLIIGESVKIIGSHAANTKTLKYVYSKSTTPPAGSDNMFYSGLKAIYVPIGSADTYRNTKYWEDYASVIVEYNFEE